MSEAVTTSDIEMERLYVRDPKKYDESYLCKVHYLSEEGDKGRLLVWFKSAKLIKLHCINSNAYYVYLKPSKKDIKNILSMEDEFVKISKCSSSRWFPKRIKCDVIEEYFQSSVLVHKSHGSILKMRIENPLNNMINQLENEKVYDVQVRIHSLKFQKQSFNILWDVEDWVETDHFGSPRVLLADDQDDKDDEEEELYANIEQAIGHDILDIRHNLVSRIDRLLCDRKSKLEEAQNAVMRLETILSDAQVASNIKLLDSIANVVHEYDE